jgi:hypothetical protein
MLASGALAALFCAIALWNPDGHPLANVVAFLVPMLALAGLLFAFSRSTSRMGCYFSTRGVKVRSFLSSRTIPWTDVDAEIAATPRSSWEWLIVVDRRDGQLVRVPSAMRPSGWSNRENREPRRATDAQHLLWSSFESAVETIRNLRAGSTHGA